MSTGYQTVPQSIYNESHRRAAVERLFTPLGVADYSDIDREQMALYQWAIDYIEPMKIRVVMKDRNHFNPDPDVDNLVYYDMFDAEDNNWEKNNVRLRRLSCSNNNTSAGVFAFTLADPERAIDETKVGQNNIVIIQAKKHRNQNWQNLMFGICRNDEHDIYGSVGNDIVYSGFGSAAIANEILLDFKRIASRSGINSANPYRQDPTMYASKLVEDAFIAADVYPVVPTAKFPNAKDRGFFDLSGINYRIEEFIAGLNAPLVTLARVLNDIAALIGANWWIDETNKVIFDFIYNRASGHVVKKEPKSTDNPDLTSYFFSKWHILKSTEPSQGFANKLWANVDVIDIQASGGSGEGGSVHLGNKDLAQQLPAGVVLKDIALLIQRNGAGTTDPARITTLHGHIVKDYNNTPTGKVVVYFDIPLSSIPTGRASAVFIPNLTIQKNVTVASNEKLWIILYDRGREQDNTILWFHDTGTTSRNAIRPISAYTGLDHNTGTGWSINENSYSFAFAAFNRSIQRVSAYDPYSIYWNGLVEQAVSVPLANDPATVDKFLHQMLIYTAKPKLTMGDVMVSVPNQLLKPRMTIAIEDNRLGFINNRQLLLENNGVSYDFNADSNATGSQFCGINPTGLYDRRQHFFRRASKIFKCKNCPNE